MNFLRCIFCGEGPVKIFEVPANGVARSRCMNCGLNSTHDIMKNLKTKGPEVIYK